jgi:uncharacterized membrane protein
VGAKPTAMTAAPAPALRSRAPESRSPSASRPRFVFLDVLRLIAAVQMIQGHSVASVLAPAYRTGLGYEAWSFVRGLTSVIFLVTAGLSFVLAEGRESAQPARATAARTRARRALRLIGLGYLMHAPLGALVGAPLAETLRASLAVDVLHCIGASLLSLELLALLFARPVTRAWVAGSLGLVAFWLAPSTRAWVFPAHLLPLGNYLTSAHGSLFPLLPWAGYVWLGFAIGSLTFGGAARVARSLSAFGGAALALSALCQLGLLPAPAAGASGPAFSLVKLACVLLLAAALAHALRNVRQLPRWLAALAGETLFLYLSHVLILYADQVGLEPRLRDRHGPWFGLLLAAGLLLVCSAGALGLRSLRARSHSGTRAAPSP